MYHYYHHIISYLNIYFSLPVIFIFLYVLMLLFEHLVSTWRTNFFISGKTVNCMGLLPFCQSFSGCFIIHLFLFSLALFLCGLMISSGMLRFLSLYLLWIYYRFLFCGYYEAYIKHLICYCNPLLQFSIQSFSSLAL